MGGGYFAMQGDKPCLFCFYCNAWHLKTDTVYNSMCTHIWLHFFISAHACSAIFWTFNLAYLGDLITITIITLLTTRVTGAPLMISWPVSSIFPCSPLPSGIWRTPGLSIAWCLSTCSFVCLVFFPLSLFLARWFRPNLLSAWAEDMSIPLQFVSLYNGDLTTWIFFSSVQFSPLIEWVIRDWWGTIQQRSSSSLFCRRPLWAVLAKEGMFILWCCLSSISFADHGITHPPRCPEGWFWRGCHGVWHVLVFLRLVYSFVFASVRAGDRREWEQHDCSPFPGQEWHPGANAQDPRESPASRQDPVIVCLLPHHLWWVSPHAERRTLQLSDETLPQV